MSWAESQYYAALVTQMLRAGTGLTYGVGSGALVYSGSRHSAEMFSRTVHRVENEIGPKTAEDLARKFIKEMGSKYIAKKHAKIVPSGRQRNLVPRFRPGTIFKKRRNSFIKKRKTGYYVYTRR